jgi:6-phosphogluconolactonase
MTRIVYVGTSTNDGGAQRAEGIFVYRMDAESGSMEQIQAVESGPEPSFLALHPNRRYLYSVNEASEGQACAFAVDPASGQLSFLNREGLGSAGPCYAAVSPDGKWLLTANYSGGSLSVLPIGGDGRLGPKSQVVQHEGSSADAETAYTVRDERGTLAVLEKHASGQGVMPDRQEAAHAHSAIFDPGQRLVLAADLGMDRVWVYGFDFERGRITAAEPPLGVSSRAGAGPRHMAFHPNGRYLYVANELDSTLDMLAWDGESGSLRPMQTLSTLPEGFSEESWVADIHFTPDGRFLYVSNRGHDSLACFRADAESGQLTPAGHFSTQGSWPRNFGITPDGRFLLAANQKGDSIVVFRLEAETGRLEPSGAVVSVRAPMFVSAVDLTG